MAISNKIKQFAGAIKGLFTSTAPRGVELDANGAPTFWPINFLPYTYNERNFQEFVGNGYGRNPYVFMVIDRVATVLSSLPIFLQGADGNPISNPNAMKLMGAPNSQESWGEFMYRVVSSYMATGNAIIYETTALGFNTPSELRCALTQNVTIYTDNGTDWGVPKTYYILNHGNIDASRVLHIKRPSILNDTVWGLSPLHSGQTVYEGSNNTFKAGASIHNNRGASGIISSASADIPMSPKERELVQNEFNRNTAGAHNTGINYVASVPVQFTSIGMNATDLKLIEFNINHLRTVCSLYHTDSSIFNDPANSTYNNVSEARKALYTDAVLPLAENIYDQLSIWLIVGKLRVPGRIVVDESQIEALQEERNKKHERVNKDLQAGIITAPEARMMLYPDLPNNITPAQQ